MKFNEISCGYCINNSSPYMRSHCDCYKYPVPYSLFGRNGVLLLCREWFNYMMVYNDFDGIRNCVIDCIKERNTDIDFNQVSLSEFGWGCVKGTRLGVIRTEVSPSPIKICASVAPSYFLTNIEPPESDLWNWDNFYVKDVPPPLLNKLSRIMNILMETNIRRISDYVSRRGGGIGIKKYDDLFNQLQKKIKTYETA